MPRFDPFRGIRYDAEDGYLDAVIAPPYDVVDERERAALAARNPYNAIRVELPEDGAGRYRAAGELFRSWLAEGALVRDDEPSFYVYRMGFHDEAGRPRQTTGVIGALELSPPGRGDILPHERTTPKDKADRLELLRATKVNLSPIWALSPAAGLASLCELPGPPDARATDDEGVHHRLWRVSRPGLVEAISTAVGSAPVVVADGHHRLEVALAYQQERRAAGAGAGGHDAVMTFVVELAEEQLSVQAIHRLLAGLPDGFDLPRALSRWFELFETAPADETLPARMLDAGALALVVPGATWLLRPRPETVAAAALDLDSSRLDVALADLPAHALRFQHGVRTAIEAVAGGVAQAAVLLRPAPVAQIAAIGQGGERMPPKTTFFSPKPRTGMVFREVAG